MGVLRKYCCIHLLVFFFLWGDISAIAGQTDDMDMSHITPEAAHESLLKPIGLDELKFNQIITEHLHNKIAHFPFVMGLMYVFILLISHWYPDYDAVAKFILMMAATTGLVAVFTGQNQANSFHEPRLIEILSWHEQAGFVSLGFLLLGASLQWFPSFRKFRRFYAGFLTLSLCFTGFLGGVLSHFHP